MQGRGLSKDATKQYIQKVNTQGAQIRGAIDDLTTLARLIEGAQKYPTDYRYLNQALALVNRVKHSLK